VGVYIVPIEILCLFGSLPVEIQFPELSLMLEGESLYEKAREHFVDAYAIVIERLTRDIPESAGAEVSHPSDAAKCICSGRVRAPEILREIVNGRSNTNPVSSRRIDTVNDD
jgi:hypothetical protein